MVEPKLMDTAFLLPVVRGEIFLAQRGTLPYEGYWGPVGGKSDKKKIKSPWDKPHLVEKMGGHLVIGVSDRVAEEDGREFLQGTAVREFCEEMFHGKRFPRDFKKKDITDIVKLGWVRDWANVKGQDYETANFFYMARINRADFSPSPREIRGFKPLSAITENDKMFPIGKIALMHIYYSLLEKTTGNLNGYEDLERQIKPLLKTGFMRADECRHTSMFGVFQNPDYVRCIQGR